MTEDLWDPGSGIANRASLLVLETEAGMRLSFPGEFLGYEGPCGRAERAVSSEADPEVRSAAQCVHDRAREISSCLRNLRRLAEGIASVEFPAKVPDTGKLAIEDAKRALDEAERAVDVMVREFHARLWKVLPPEAAEAFAASLLRRLKVLKKEATKAREASAASEARWDWHRAANIISWWSDVAPGPFLQAGFKAKRDLRPLAVAREPYEGLVHLS